MRDYILTFQTEPDAIAALQAFRIQSDDKEQWTGAIIPNATRWITRPQYDEDGSFTTEPETVPGWHCIVRIDSLPEAAQPFLVADPGDIEPIPAGGLLEPPIPQSVTALQGMLAIKASGLVPAFVAWKSGLDPVTDFEILAFLDKAETWEYDNTILDKGLTDLGVAEQKPALFRLAATL